MTRLDYEMNERGMSDTALAAAIGKTTATVGNYRAGTSLPRVDIGLKIAELFGVPVADMFTEVQFVAMPIAKATEPVTA